MQILAKVQKFPESIDATVALIDSIRVQIRDHAARYNDTENSSVRVSEAAKIAALEDRKGALERHLAQLIDEAVMAHELAAMKAAQQPKRQLPKQLELPKKSKPLLAAEKAVDLAVQKVDAAHQAIVEFANSDHSNITQAYIDGAALETTHRAAVKEHLAASLVLTREREAWQAACDAFLESEFQARKAAAHELLEQLEDTLWPLRSRTFHMMTKLRALRKVIR